MTRPQFVLCIKNKDYPASLEVRKVYRVIPDTQASQHKMIRVVDESEEDYLYPVDYFVAIDLPKIAEEAFLSTSIYFND